MLTSVTSVVRNSPRFSTDDAVRLAQEYYGLRASAEALPSERDQNFLMRHDAGHVMQFFIPRVLPAFQTS